MVILTIRTLKGSFDYFPTEVNLLLPTKVNVKSPGNSKVKIIIPNPFKGELH